MSDSEIEASRPILEAASKARSSVTLIAPFVKFGALERLISCIPPEVPVRLFTRWQLEEIASGVSDPEVWTLVNAREEGQVFLYHRLHAKCFLFDSVAMVGSANITGRALGWHAQPNLELVIPVRAGSQEVQLLLAEVERLSFLVTAAVAEKFAALAANLRKAHRSGGRRERAAESALSSTSGTWIPVSRQPSQLYSVYRGDDRKVPTAGLEAALSDLDYLGIPPGLSREDFSSAVELALYQVEFFQRVDEFCILSRRFGEMRRMVSEFLLAQAISRDASDVWQTGIRWIQLFCRNRYEVRTANYSEILFRLT